MKRYFSEMLGTFFLVFAGCGAIVINQINPGSVGSVGIALTFGFVVMAMIYSVGDISGAHFNPAVSFGFWLARRLSLSETIRYIFSQTLGATLAATLLKILFPMSITLGNTVPAVGFLSQAFILEIVMTALLMFVILSVSTGAKEKGMMAGLAIGVTVALEALFGGPISGASMNPARSLAPALLSLHFEFLWIYLTAPFLGSCLAVFACRACQQEGCCS